MTTTCISCGEETTETMQATIGDKAGPMCADCQYWADGNVAEPATHIATNAWNASTNAWDRIDIERLGEHDSTDLSQVELNADDFGGQPGATYLVQLLNADGKVIDSTEIVATGA